MLAVFYRARVLCRGCWDFYKKFRDLRSYWGSRGSLDPFFFYVGSFPYFFSLDRLGNPISRIRHSQLGLAKS